MKIKFVYVLVCGEDDLYTEQMWASIYSLRRYNADARIEILVASDTYNYLLVNYNFIFNFVDNIISFEVPHDFSFAAKSRYLKTSIRNIIDGDFVFLDTDTIVCSDLSKLDQYAPDILCVNDLHVDFLRNPYYQINVKLINQVFKTDISNAVNYFNSGVMLVKDNTLTRTFYKSWHENWIQGYTQFALKTDQQSLLKTDADFGFIIKPLDGIYNCQIVMSVKYLTQAKIMHFFNNLTLDKDKKLSPFLNGELFKKMKEQKHMSKDIEDEIVNCKSSFNSISPIIGYKEFQFLCSPIGQSMLSLINKKQRWNIVFSFLAYIFNCINKISK